MSRTYKGSDKSARKAEKAYRKVRQNISRAQGR